MIVAFDLHNIRDGGGVNYIRNLLANAEPGRDGFARIHLVGAPRLLAGYPDRPWIVKHGFAALDRGLLHRLWFVRTKLEPLLRRVGCDVLYVPGGLIFTRFRPFVTISRNMMPFRNEFWSMYPTFSADRWRLRLLRRLNAATFASADGMIFLSETAKQVISRFIRRPLSKVAVIAHGVDRERFSPLGRRRQLRQKGEDVELVYPSRLEPYKHQVEVVRAMGLLVAARPDLRLRLCGPANPAYLEEYRAALAAHPAAGERIDYVGEVPNAALPALYAESDLLLFASSCENLPNILIEAMASGIPICCSDRSPMPEISKDACVYFDPTDPGSIAAAVDSALDDWAGTLARADRALEYSRAYSWTETAQKTFRFIVDVARGGR